MSEITLTVHHETGLHARPLAQFVKVAKTFAAEIKVWNATTGKGPVDGKSALGLLLLAVQAGHTIRIASDGADADEVLAALQNLVESNFAGERSNEGA